MNNSTAWLEGNEEEILSLTSVHYSCENPQLQVSGVKKVSQ